MGFMSVVFVAQFKIIFVFRYRGFSVYCFTPQIIKIELWCGDEGILYFYIFLQLVHITFFRVAPTRLLSLSPQSPRALYFPLPDIPKKPLQRREEWKG